MKIFLMLALPLLIGFGRAHAFSEEEYSSSIIDFALSESDIKNKKIAFREKNDYQAAVDLSNFYIFVMKDKLAALYWLSEAAAYGGDREKFTYATFLDSSKQKYLESEGIAKIHLLAKSGYAPAQDRYADYLSPLWEKPPEEALDWYYKAAKQGCLKAQEIVMRYRPGTDFKKKKKDPCELE